MDFELKIVGVDNTQSLCFLPILETGHHMINKKWRIFFKNYFFLKENMKQKKPGCWLLDSVCLFTQSLCKEMYGSYFFFLKNNSFRAVDAAYICEAPKDLMPYVAQMATLGGKKSQLAKFKYRMSSNGDSSFIHCNTMIEGTKKRKSFLRLLYIFISLQISMPHQLLI